MIITLLKHINAILLQLANLTKLVRYYGLDTVKFIKSYSYFYVLPSLHGCPELGTKYFFIFKY